MAITAGTVYVASYFAPAGHYAGDGGYFATAGVDNGPLHALKDGVSGGNGVYAYGGASSFPTNTYQLHQLLGRRRLHLLTRRTTCRHDRHEAGRPCGERRRVGR